jgi:hypothetical protein
MHVIGDTIVFRSTLPNYWKELTGRKPNTVREIPYPEVSKWGIEVTDDGVLTSDGKFVHTIGIELVGEPTEYFTRELTDVTVYEGRYIFSWRA